MFKVKEDVLQAIINYLAKQPYEQTFQLIAALQQVEKIKEPEIKEE